MLSVGFYLLFLYNTLAHPLAQPLAHPLVHPIVHLQSTTFNPPPHDSRLADSRRRAAA
jgi:hypothetical protein